MKKKYLSPEVEINFLTLETNFLGNSAENMTSASAIFADWDDED